MERASHFAARDSCFQSPCIPPCTLFVEGDKGIQPGIQPCDLREMGIQQVDGRNFLLTDLLRHGLGREEGQLTHADDETSGRASLACGLKYRGHSNAVPARGDGRHGPVATLYKSAQALPRAGGLLVLEMPFAA